MSTIPRDPLPDSSLAMLADGYVFPLKRRRLLDSDIFATRLMLREAICIVGEEAAQFFYSGDRFTRKGAMPPTTVRLLQGHKSVQLLDGEAFRHRKAMFMAMMAPESIQALVAGFEEQWRQRRAAWERQEEVVLHDEVQHILCRAVCAWAGIPISERSANQRTRELAASVEGAGSVGPRLLWALILRANSERWGRRVIAAIRAGTPKIPEGSPAHAIAMHRDLDGELLDLDTASVELNNILRPTVAVARYIAFCALALHDYPHCRDALRDGDEAAVERFVQEVRRFYPFFPAMGGRARTDLEWDSHHFAEGAWVLLDGYGTNRDPRVWGDAQVFRPERFRDWDGSPYNFIPQGGGDYHADHRCPGEWITIALMKSAVRQLVSRMRYDVPEQDLSVDLGKMPAIPESRFVISRVAPLDPGLDPGTTPSPG